MNRVPKLNKPKYRQMPIFRQLGINFKFKISDSRRGEAECHTFISAFIWNPNSGYAC